MTTQSWTNMPISWKFKSKASSLALSVECKAEVSIFALGKSWFKNRAQWSEMGRKADSPSVSGSSVSEADHMSPHTSFVLKPACPGCPSVTCNPIHPA